MLAISSIKELLATVLEMLDSWCRRRLLSDLPGELSWTNQVLDFVYHALQARHGMLQLQKARDEAYTRPWRPDGGITAR
jgi:hypothetical protein